VLSNGEEVKLQRNALAVLEYGPEDQQVLAPANGTNDGFARSCSC
jgi:hypothetical protein